MAWIIAQRSEEHTSELQSPLPLVCRFFNDTATTEIYTLSLHDALPICASGASGGSLDNCTLTGNGYGANGCMLYNCALTGNHYYGAYSSTLNNCTVAGNSGNGVDNCTEIGRAHV